MNLKPQQRLCKDWLSTYIEYCKSQESPELFHYWTALSVVGASMQRNAFIDRGFYTLFPNLYVIIIAASGAQRKSVSTGIGIKLLKKACPDLTIIHDRATPEGLMDVMQSKRQDPNDPLQIVDDSVIYIYASELGVFLGSAKYLADLIPILTNLYDGKEDTGYITKTKGKLKIKDGLISILGCSTPDWIPRCMPDDAVGGGFTSRFIFVSAPGSKKNAWPQKTQEMIELEKKLIHDLALISTIKGEFVPTSAARQWFDDWYCNVLPAQGDQKLDGYFSRKHDHILKLAMLISACRNDQYVIDTHHIQMAKAALEAVEPFMTRAFSTMGITDQHNIGMKVMMYMYQQGGKVKYSDILRRLSKYVKNSEQLKDAMFMLDQQGYVQQIISGKSTFWSLLIDPNTLQ